MCWPLNFPYSIVLKQRSELFGVLLTETILFPIPRRHFTFGIPKMLRAYLRFNREPA